MEENPCGHVLLVDDDPVQIAILSAYFRTLQAGRISTALNSLKALEILDCADEPVGLIVSDLQMPEMDGLESLRHLKDRQYTGRLAIMSGVKSDILEHAARLAKLQGLNLIGHLGKPVSKAGLDAILRKPVAGRNGADALSPAQDPLTIAKMRDAIAAGSITPFYQPKIDTRTRTLYGAECLARWLDADGRPVHRPDAFIAFAEENGLIPELTFALFGRFLRDVVRFRAISRGLHFAFNLTPSLLADTSLPDGICSMMREQGLPAASVGFEITENLALNPDSRNLEVLSRLRIYDFDIAIDDFGTGHANIANLKDFPFTELKIDQSFVRRAARDAFSRQTVMAAVSLARSLDMPVVAEGVEDREAWELVRGLGIERAQGYLIAKPMDAEAFARYAAINRDNAVLAA